MAAIPAEALLALKSVHRVAGCYGFPLHGTRDRTIVMAVIALSMISEPEGRVKCCEKIQSLDHGQADEPDTQRLGKAIAEDIRAEAVDDAVDELETSLLEQALGESVPLLGSAIGVVLDNRFIREIETAARCVFQERWLRYNGKVDEIAPVEVPGGVLASLGRAAYVTAYAVGFGVVLPVALTARAAEYLLPRPALDGLKDGATSAVGQVEHLFPEHPQDLDSQRDGSGAAAATLPGPA
jgi:hypothetical protein